MKCRRKSLDHFTDCEFGFLNNMRYLTMDRDTKFSRSFCTFFKNEGIKPVRMSPYAPYMNAYLERLFGSLRSECLGQLVFFAEKAIRNAVRCGENSRSYVPNVLRISRASAS